MWIGYVILRYLKFAPGNIDIWITLSLILFLGKQMLFLIQIGQEEFQTRVLP